MFGFISCGHSGPRLYHPLVSHCCLYQTSGKGKEWRHGHLQALPWAWAHYFCSHSWWQLVWWLHISAQKGWEMMGQNEQLLSSDNSVQHKWSQFYVEPAVSAVGLTAGCSHFMYIWKQLSKAANPNREEWTPCTSQWGPAGLWHQTWHRKARWHRIAWSQGDCALLLLPKLKKIVTACGLTHMFKSFPCLRQNS